MAGPPRRTGRPNLAGDFPNRIRATRLARDMTLSEVEGACGLKSGALSLIERGGKRLLVSELEAIAGVLQVPPQMLLNSVDPLTDAQESQIIDIFRRIPTPIERERFLRMAEAFVAGPAAVKA
jgi:transcriptional regulator with XRE-family HTH domain